MCRNIYMNISIHVTTISKNEVMNFIESKEWYMGKFGGRKGE